MIARIVSVLILGLCAPSVAAEIGAMKGTEPLIWNDHSVVYADVIGITPLRADYGNAWVFLLTLKVRTTLKGFWDAAADPEVKVEVYHVFREPPDIAKSQMPESLPLNSHIVVVIARLRDGRYIVRPSPITFMPNQRGIVVVDGVDDKKLTRIIATLNGLHTDLEEVWNVLKRAQRSPPAIKPSPTDAQGKVKEPKVPGT